MKRLSIILAAVPLLFAACNQNTIPADPEFRVGRLPNGMTYYICHNELPEGCADFYIAHNVGALQEEDDQNGLALFLEHMAFNGTRHFPGKSMQEFLAKDGVRFGYNINAYTSKTETVYNISSVPLVRDSFIDSVLLVLHDWSCDISCEQEAIDAERGVVSEEWRLRDGDSRYNMLSQQTKLIYKGSRQAERSVLGSLEVINSFKRQDILDFYHKWYRPDLQAIIVVGDFDVDKMEERVKEKFSDIPAAVKPEPKVRFIPPRLKEPLIEDMTDSRIKYVVLKMLYKQPYPEGNVRLTEDYLRDVMSRQIITSALGERFRRICLDKDAPARSAVVVTSEHEPDYYVTLITVSPRSKELLADSFGMTQREIRRMLEFGISREEFEAAKLSTSQRYRLDREQAREEVKSEELSRIAVENFLRNHPLVDPVDLRDLQNRILSEISYESVKDYPSKMFVASEKIYSTCYNKEADPGAALTPDQVHAIINSVNAEALDPQYSDFPKLDLNVDTAPGFIVSRSLDGRLGGYEIWKLSNGVTVYYKQAPPVKSNYHLVTKWRFDTGCRSYPEDRLDAARVAAAMIHRTVGFRGRERPEFRNCPELTGVNIITHTLQQYSSLTISAGAGKEETAFKTGWLLLMEPFFGRPGTIEKAKDDYLKRLSHEKSPRTRFEEKCDRMEFGDHPWLRPMDTKAVEAVDMNLLQEVYTRAFGDFGGLSVFICSDLNRSVIDSYVRKYVASLNGTYTFTKTDTPFPAPVLTGYNLITETNPPESEPVSIVNYTYYPNIMTGTRSLVLSDFLDYIATARYMDLIREKRGGTYHVSFRTEVPDNPVLPWKGVVAFHTRPELTDLLLGDVNDVMQDLAENGPTAEEMELARKYLNKRHGEEERRTAMSLNAQMDRLVKTVLWNRDYDYDHEALLETIKASEIRAMARKFLNGTTIVEVYTEKNK